MANSPTFPSTTGPIQIGKRIVPADTTTIVDVYDNSAGAAAVKIEALSVATDNTADRLLTFYAYGVSGSTNSDILGSVNIPDLSGTNGATDPRVNVLAKLGVAGADGVVCLWIGAGKKLRASLDAALATDKTLYITGRAITYS